MAETKICSKCGKEFPTEYFHKDKEKPDGLRGDCRKCKSEYDKNRRNGKNQKQNEEIQKIYNRMKGR